MELKLWWNTKGVTLFFLHKFLQQKEMGGHSHSGFAKVIDLTEGGGMILGAWVGCQGKITSAMAINMDR